MIIIDHLPDQKTAMAKTKLFPIFEALFAVLVWGASFIATNLEKYEEEKFGCGRAISQEQILDLGFSTN